MRKYVEKETRKVILLSLVIDPLPKPFCLYVCFSYKHFVINPLFIFFLILETFEHTPK